MTARPEEPRERRAGLRPSPPTQLALGTSPVSARGARRDIPRPATTPEPPRSVVRRITTLLSIFRWGGSYSITEMARLTGLPVSTTHRLAAELAASHILQREADGRYRVGLMLQLLGGQGDDWTAPTLLERAPHVLTDLSEATRRRARLGVFRGDRVAYVEKRVGSEPATPFDPRTTLPAHATALGKALLAFAPNDVVKQVSQHLTAYTPRTLTTPGRLGHALGIIRLTRLAIAHGELVPGDFAVATPVFGVGGTVIAALELEARSAADLELSRVALMVAAGGLSRELAGARAESPTGTCGLLPDGEVSPWHLESILATAADRFPWSADRHASRPL